MNAAAVIQRIVVIQRMRHRAMDERGLWCRHAPADQK